MMNPKLTFSTELSAVAPLGEPSCVPDLLGFANLQNKSSFELEDTDEIYEDYGRLQNAFPYRQYTCYERSLEQKPVRTAILENDFLRAVFLPEYGGRLWRLTDKKAGRELLYTNDVIRASNLAVRGAWFSGGVEWNIGVIGHSPLTMEPLFTARLKTEQGFPVLRMYEYERIRGLVYQMDFWLEEDTAFLNCRMRVENPSATVIPMYWWSNMAVPEYQGGRVLAPAQEAFTSNGGRVYKVDLPMVDGVDVSRYCDIPYQVDYFFHLDSNRVPCIANLDQTGYGLLHYSTARLQSRKLFAWGNTDASSRWQEFLTQDAGRYVEIQAGLGKTQYGCIPMAPHTAWEWMERYGPVTLDSVALSEPFSQAQQRLASVTSDPLSGLLSATRAMAKASGELVYSGSGYGALENLRRSARAEAPLPLHLDFTSPDGRQKEWRRLLAHGNLQKPKASHPPLDFISGDDWRAMLTSCANGKGADNWYVWYQLGVLLLAAGERKQARKALKVSNKLHQTPWALHALAVCALQRGKQARAASLILRGLHLLEGDLAYTKEAFRILLRAGAYSELLACWESLPSQLTADGRLLLGRVEALYYTGRCREAYRLLTDGSGLEVSDLREGEDTIGQLWQALHRALYGRTGELPHFFNFNSLPPTREV